MVSKTMFATAIAPIALGAAILAASAPAEARSGRNAALLGGLAAGAIVGGAIASAHARPYYYAPRAYAPGYYAPSYHAPSYYAPGYYAPAYRAPACWRENRAVYDAWGNFAGYRAVRVCR